MVKIQKCFAATQEKNTNVYNMRTLLYEHDKLYIIMWSFILLLYLIYTIWLSSTSCLGRDAVRDYSHELCADMSHEFMNSRQFGILYFLNKILL